jgi:hypothetical protein
MTGARAVTPLAAILVVAAVAAMLLLDARSQQQAFPRYATQDTSGEGMSLALAWLHERDPRRRVESVTLPADALPAGSVVFRFNPHHDETKIDEMMREARENAREQQRREDERERQERKERGEPERPPAEAEEDPETVLASGRFQGRWPAPTREEWAWMSQGGRLVLGLEASEAGLVLEDVDVAEPAKAHPWPPGVSVLRPPKPRVMSGAALGLGHALFLLGDRSLVHRIPVGRGDLVILACPEILLNEHLGEVDHLALLEALAPPGRDVAFDDRASLGEPGVPLVALLGRLGLAPAVVIGALTAALAAWRRAMPVGPPSDPFRDMRSVAVDFVDALAVLYRRVLSRADLLGLQHEDLVRRAALRTGLRGERLARHVERAIGAAPLPRGSEPSEGVFVAELRRMAHAMERIEREKHR